MGIQYRGVGQKHVLNGGGGRNQATKNSWRTLFRVWTCGNDSSRADGAGQRIGGIKRLVQEYDLMAQTRCLMPKARYQLLQSGGRESSGLHKFSEKRHNDAPCDKYGSEWTRSANRGQTGLLMIPSLDSTFEHQTYSGAKSTSEAATKSKAVKRR